MVDDKVVIKNGPQLRFPAGSRHTVYTINASEVMRFKFQNFQNERHL
jgi:hypothetical protein